jgi:hypothetical protein
MTGRTVALIAHSPGAGGTARMARDAVAFAVALMLHRQRVLLHADPVLAVPVLFAAEAARAPLVLEGAGRQPHPIILMPMATWSEGPESALFAPVIGAGGTDGEDRRRSSLLDQLDALGLVDGRWLRGDASSPRVILAEEAPSDIIAMGWSPAMEDVVRAAEDYARENDASLLLAGDRTGPMRERRGWRDLSETIDFPIPADPIAAEWETGERRGEDEPDDLRAARREAYRQAYTMLLAETAAARSSGRLEAPA